MILLDASGSMSGKSFELAITTVSAILDTLSDNDFVNLISFSDKTRSVVPCFKDKMVNADLNFINFLNFCFFFFQNLNVVL